MSNPFRQVSQRRLPPLPGIKHSTTHSVSGSASGRKSTTSIASNDSTTDTEHEPGGGEGG